MEGVQTELGKTKRSKVNVSQKQLDGRKKNRKPAKESSPKKDVRKRMNG